jgi:ABC-type dipeptide/oligopeptide/nickel transport system permease component
MYYFLQRRLLGLIPVLWGVGTCVFLIIHLVPGDPAALMLGDTATAAEVATLRESLGLNAPLMQQYAEFFQRLCTGDLGMSLRTRQPVISMVLERLPATLELTVASLIVALTIALPMGILTAAKRYTAIDDTGLAFSLIGVSIPAFWLGPMLIIVFGLWLGWLPVSGRGGLLHVILPAVSLGVALAAMISRLTRSSLIEVLDQDYIRTARAKGLAEWRILLRHALRNALVPVVTIVGLQFGALLGGTVITEVIFAWPGVGRLLITAIQARDYPLVQGCVLVIAFCYVIINFLVDLLYAVIDPRVSYS